VSLAALWNRVQGWASELGFSQITVADIDLHTAEEGLLAWLQAGFAGHMEYLHRHGLKRVRPAELVPGTVRVLCVRMDYRPALPAISPGPGEGERRPQVQAEWRTLEWSRLAAPDQAVVSMYARGRDYHKVLRTRLEQLARRLRADVGSLGYRAFVDSAPVAEVELAQRSGLGWRGKHTLLLHPDHGSLFFLGELFVDIPFSVTPPTSTHCGSCQACLTACPTGAIVAPYQLDARRCISYLTIESDAPIPLELRPQLGNRIYGCDDCQLACPWNKFARVTSVPDFSPRHGLDTAALLDLWAWTEPVFLQRTEGSAIRRAGWLRWRRNLAVALGNAMASPEASAVLKHAVREALLADHPHAAPLVAEHIAWALAQGPVIAPHGAQANGELPSGSPTP
jgi:epoxyqueuosine reductase